MAVKMKATHAFSGSQTSATYLDRIESDEEFEAQTEEDAAYLIRNGFATKVEETPETDEAPIAAETVAPKRKPKKRTAKAKTKAKPRTKAMLQARRKATKKRGK
jgi:hypothetical protein